MEGCTKSSIVLIKCVDLIIARIQSVDDQGFFSQKIDVGRDKNVFCVQAVGMGETSKFDL